jgi:hypothetical protein
MHLTPSLQNRKPKESSLGNIQIETMSQIGDNPMLTPSKEPIHCEENKSTVRKYMRIPDRLISLEALSKIKINRGRIIDWFF